MNTLFNPMLRDGVWVAEEEPEIVPIRYVPRLRVEVHALPEDKASAADTWNAVLAVCGDRRAK